MLSSKCQTFMSNANAESPARHTPPRLLDTSLLPCVILTGYAWSRRRSRHYLPRYQRLLLHLTTNSPHAWAVFFLFDHFLLLSIIRLANAFAQAKPQSIDFPEGPSTTYGALSLFVFGRFRTYQDVSGHVRTYQDWLADQYICTRMRRPVCLLGLKPQHMRSAAE